MELNSIVFISFFSTKNVRRRGAEATTVGVTSLHWIKLSLKYKYLFKRFVCIRSKKYTPFSRLSFTKTIYCRFKKGFFFFLDRKF